MMKIKLKNFQKGAIQELFDKIESLNFSRQQPKTVLFEAPTGSGKTIILSKFIEQFLQSRQMHNQNFACIWLTPGKGKLHLQSKDKIAEALLYSGIQVLHFAEILQEPCFSNNTVAVLNWEKIGRSTNTISNDNETLSLKNFLQKTQLNTDLIAIVDEEHYAQTKKTNAVINLFAPTLIIRTSATPKKGHFDAHIKVHQYEVIEEKLILKKYKLNQDLEQFKKPVDSIIGENLFLLEAALVKREELLKLYKNENSLVNPLIIIQLPDEKTEYETIIKEQTKDFLNNKQISIENKLLAIDLDKEKENIVGLKKNSAWQIIVITKQTITHGWDCPRAQILVKLRHNSEKRFNIQTLGRICRVPEVERGHYKNDILNFGYVYTFDKSLIKIADSDGDSQEPSITFSFDLEMKSKWKKTTLDLKIPNQMQYLDKVIDKNDNEIEFAVAFNNWFREKQSLDGLGVASEKVAKVLNGFAPLKQSTMKISYETGEISGDWYDKKASVHEIVVSYENDGVKFLSTKFDYFFCHFLTKKLQLKNWTFIKLVFEYLFSKNYLNSDDLKKTGIQYLYDFDFWGNSEQKKQQEEAYFYCYLLNSREKWLDLLKQFCKFLSKQQMQAINTKLNEKYMEIFMFSEFKEYSFQIQNLQEKNYSKLPSKNNNLYKNFTDASCGFSKPEQSFIWQFLENQDYADKFEWWFRNVENEKSAWKIIYVDKSHHPRNFYPDFILKTKDDIWIIEIKDTSNLDQNNAEKFQYLQNFCSLHKLKFAFIIAERGQEIKFNNIQWSDDFDSAIWKPIKSIFNKQKQIE